MSKRINGMDKASLSMKPLYIASKKMVGKVVEPLKARATRPSIAWFGNLLGLAIILLSVNYASAQAKNKAKVVEPTVKEAVKLIFANGDIPLTVDSSCKGVGSSQTDKTILDYLSGLLSFQAEPNSVNHIEFTFKQEKGAKNEILWLCDLSFAGKQDEETEWNWGVRFKMRNSDRSLLRSSVICTGAG